MRNIRIGDYLVEQKLISAEQLDQVLAAQKDLKNLVRDVSMNVDPFALSPVYMTGTYHSPHMKAPNF